MKKMNLRISLAIVHIMILPYFVNAITLKNLIDMAMTKNSEIISSDISRELDSISLKTLNAVYSPDISVSSSIGYPNGSDWKISPDSFSGMIMYSNSLPGGSSVAVETSYTCNMNKIQDEKFMTQIPYLSLTINQSLMPFWFQGMKKDPLKLNLKQKNMISYYQFLFTKKNVLQKLFQDYVSVLITKNELAIYKNTIDLYDEQIEALSILQNSGTEKQSKILEIENAKWSAQQNLMTVQANYISLIQSLKTICGGDFDEFLLESNENLDFETEVLSELDGVVDPMEEIYKIKLDYLKTSRVYEKQSTAPVLSMQVRPTWNLKTTKQDEWETAWEDFGTPDLWNFTVKINLTPMISGICKQNNRKYELNYQDAEDAYNKYLYQKQAVIMQYETILNAYKDQRYFISILYKNGQIELSDYKILYENNVISKFDYDSVRIRIENCNLTKENIDLNIWLYEMLFNFSK